MCKIYFQDSGHGGHLGFQIGMILVLFYLCYLMLTTKFGVSMAFGAEEEAKNRFSRCQSSWISNQNKFSYFDLLVTPLLPIKFQDNQPFVSGEAKNRSWISHQNNFSNFLSTSHPNASYQVSCQMAFCFGRRSEK